MVDFLYEHPFNMDNRPYYNAHWTPQSINCHLDKFLPLYDFVGSQENLSEHARIVLKDLGLWEEYGASGWPGGEDEFLPLQSNAHHKTESSQQSQSMYTPELLDKVKTIYKEDYDMIESLGLTGEHPVIRRQCRKGELPAEDESVTREQ